MNRSSNLHEKKTGKLLPCYPVRSCIAAALLLVMSFFPVSSSFASGGTDFEIPISELSKEKKPSPSNHTPGKPKKKKKNIRHIIATICGTTVVMKSLYHPIGISMVITMAHPIF